MSDVRQLAEKRADAKIGFYKKFIVYIAVNAFLAVINVVYTPQYLWVLVPVFLWGIKIVIEFLKAFVFPDTFETAKYREQKIQEEMEILRNKS